MANVKASLPAVRDILQPALMAFSWRWPSVEFSLQVDHAADAIKILARTRIGKFASRRVTNTLFTRFELENAKSITDLIPAFDERVNAVAYWCYHGHELKPINPSQEYDDAIAAQDIMDSLR